MTNSNRWKIPPRKTPRGDHSWTVAETSASPQPNVAKDIEERRAKYKAQQKEKKKRSPKRFVTWKIKSAIRSGKLIKPTKCARCGAEGILDAHHPHGWDTPEKVFDIEWLCRACHIQEHQNNREIYRNQQKGNSMPIYKGVQATEPLTSSQALEAALHWYVQGIKTLRDAQWEEGQLLPRGDVSTHYYNYQLWTETSRQMWIGLPHEQRKQYDERLPQLMAALRYEGMIERVVYSIWGEELLVSCSDGRKQWFFVKQMTVPGLYACQRIYWNTSFVYGTAPGGGNEVLAMLRRPSQDEIDGIKEMLRNETDRQ
ncbi:MAG: hypothetical protein U0X20_07935 [Caldilineaceae bacterium]